MFPANDIRLSLKAKGVMYYLLSKPDGWRGYVYDILKFTPCGKKSVQTALRQLREFGYVELIKERDEIGNITSYYKIYDEPKN